MTWFMKNPSTWFGVKRIFLDYASATPVLPEVRKVMEKYWSKDFYNPNAIYTEGLEVRREIEDCKIKIAKILGVAKEGIIFTSGGTESNVIAIQRLKNRHVIIDTKSHPSVSEAAKNLKVSMWELDSPLPIQADTSLISTVTIDNKIGRQVRDYRKAHDSKFPLLHIDASQTIQYHKINMESLTCDLITLDASKFYGPKGVGVLVVRRGVTLDLAPLGTPAVPLIIGFTKALEIALKNREAEFSRLSALSLELMENLKKNLPRAEITHELPNIINISVPGILPEFLVLTLEREGLLASAGPACNSYKPEPPETPVRLSLGRFTSTSEIKKAIEIFCRVI